MTPSLLQLTNLRRRKKVKKPKCPVLYGNPQRKGIVVKLYLRKPKKPNSSLRKLCRLRFIRFPTKRYKRRFISAYIPGEGHTVQEFAHVLIRGGRVQDLPGIKYHVIRGKLDCLGLGKRKTARSKYGNKRMTMEYYYKDKA